MNNEIEMDFMNNRRISLKPLCKTHLMKYQHI
jgi:hypothetical protein